MDDLRVRIAELEADNKSLRDQNTQLDNDLAKLEAQLANVKEKNPNSSEFITAYMEFCKGKAPDHNEIGLAYFGAGWRAKASQPIASGQEPAGISQSDCLWARNGNSPCTASPAQQPLSDEQILDFGPGQPDAIWYYEDQMHFDRAIEAAHGIKEKS